ncbi:CD3072 family TudS-related putative desulfidase [Enterococcus alishanensis]|uniref:CD3072 family TudS-related putative desulfidase n=1 Tax=Enterococcus TaxID=1350 RepID=UPI001FE4B652|nr:CD3072 family TudS-related putative desulfidase [Enterococcus alishanensis]
MGELFIKPQKQFVIASHCILNQNAVIHGWERARGAFPFILEILDQGIAVIQLPCPEFIFLGGNRPPMTYEEYAKLLGFREKCRELLLPIIEQVKLYLAEDYQCLGVIGIHESPNCSISGQRGVLMEEFFSLCQQENISLKNFEVPTWYEENHQEDFHENLAKFLED